MKNYLLVVFFAISIFSGGVFAEDEFSFTWNSPQGTQTIWLKKQDATPAPGYENGGAMSPNVMAVRFGYVSRNFKIETATGSFNVEKGSQFWTQRFSSDLLVYEFYGVTDGSIIIDGKPVVIGDSKISVNSVNNTIFSFEYSDLMIEKVIAGKTYKIQPTQLFENGDVRAAWLPATDYSTNPFTFPKILVQNQLVESGYIVLHPSGKVLCLNNLYYYTFKRKDGSEGTVRPYYSEACFDEDEYFIGTSVE